MERYIPPTREFIQYRDGRREPMGGIVHPETAISTPGHYSELNIAIRALDLAIAEPDGSDRQQAAYQLAIDAIRTAEQRMMQSFYHTN